MLRGCPDLGELGYEHKYGPDIACDGEEPERKDYKEVILENRVRDALFRINKGIPREALDDAFRQIITFNSPSLVENNRYFHRLLTEGIEVSFKEKGLIRTKRAYIVDFDEIKRNDFLVVNQFTVQGVETRRPDLVIFVNGILLSSSSLNQLPMRMSASKTLITRFKPTKKTLKAYSIIMLFV